VLRKTMRKKLTAKLKEVYAELRKRMHDSIPEQGAYLRSVVAGHTRYYGIPMNGPSISIFRKEVCRLWQKSAEAPQSKAPSELGPHETPGRLLDSICPYLSPLPIGAFRRYHLRQEPDEVIPHVRICAGGAG